MKAIKVIKPDFELQVGGADANLRKQFPTIGKIIFAGDDARKFLQIMHVLSKNFLNIISDQIESISNRKLAEILGIESELDAREIKAELIAGIAVLSELTMNILCDTCSVLMLIRIAPDMFTDERFDCVTVQEVCEEIFRTQRFKTKYPWRSDYKDKIRPVQSTEEHG